MIVLCYFSHGQWKILLTFTPLKMIFSVISITQLYGTFRYFNSSDPSGFSLGCPWSLCRQLPCRPWHNSRCSWLTSLPPRGQHSAKASPRALSSVRVEGLLFLTSSITITKNQKSKQLMSGNLAGQAMVLRSTWKSAGACKTVAGASFDGSL